MKKTAWLLLCCIICISAVSCSKSEDSEKSAEKDAIVGKWHITEWKADEVDQIEMWRIGKLTVEFRADGTIESQLVYSNGDERSSKGTWKRTKDGLEITITGGTGEEGDEPFERTREFAVNELTSSSFLVQGEIGPADKPIVLTYKAQRMLTPAE
jgi:hypothetical protein